MNLLAQETCPRVDDTCLIPLSRGLFAKISIVDYDAVSRFKWFAHWDKHTKSFYAVRSLYLPGEKTRGGNPKIRQVSLARFLLGLDFGDPRIADHDNHDTLDNTRANLRVTYRQGNARNRRVRSDNPTGLKGVGAHRKNGKFVGWQSQIRHAGRNIYIGQFRTPEEAHKAYCDMAMKLHGEFACLGNVDGS